MSLIVINNHAVNILQCTGKTITTKHRWIQGIGVGGGAPDAHPSLEFQHFCGNNKINVQDICFIMIGDENVNRIYHQYTTIHGTECGEAADAIQKSNAR